jgi:hypothetical protein
MTNKNRKKQLQGYVVPFPVVVTLIIAMILLLAYLWLDIRSKALGAKIKSLEQQQAELQKSYDLELWKWERMKSPSNIEKLLSQNNFAMIWPAESSIIRLKGSDSMALLAGEARPRVMQLSRLTKPIVHD